MTEADLFELQCEIDRACFTRLPRKIMAVLMSTPGVVRKEDFERHLYADDPNGGPLDIGNALSIQVMYIRESLKGTRFQIKTHFGVGYELVVT